MSEGVNIAFARKCCRGDALVTGYWLLAIVFCLLNILTA